MNLPKLRFPEFKGEWERKRLGDIAKFSKGKGISKSEIAEDGKTDCIRYGELYTRYGEVINNVYSRTNVDAKKLVLSEANDVIIPASGETQIDISTASCVIKSGVALGGDLNIIKTENNGVFLSDFKWANLSMTEQLFEDYKSKYLDLYDKVKSNNQKEKVSILEDVDFELELIHRDEINVAYIIQLLIKLKSKVRADVAQTEKEIFNLLNTEAHLRSKRELIEKFIQANLPTIKDTDDIP